LSDYLLTQASFTDIINFYKCKRIIFPEGFMPYKTPALTVDIIIEIDDRIVLIERKNPPYGWALPGGFVDYGEPLEAAAKREAKEETSLDVELISQLHTYSDPARDPRGHTVSTVFMAAADGEPIARDDAKNLGLFSRHQLPDTIVFDHKTILNDYFQYRDGQPLLKIFSDRT